jgi:hypothetical protein
MKKISLLTLKILNYGWIKMIESKNVKFLNFTENNDYDEYK